MNKVPVGYSNASYMRRIVDIVFPTAASEAAKVNQPTEQHGLGPSSQELKRLNVQVQVHETLVLSTRVPRPTLYSALTACILASALASITQPAQMHVLGESAHCPM